MTKPRFLNWPVAGMVCSICLLSLCDAGLASAQGFRAFALSDNSLLTLDIAPGVDVATSDAEPPAGSSGYAALKVAGVTSLYTIDLNTAVATSIGTIGDGTHAVQALAIQGEDVPAGLPAIAAGIGTLPLSAGGQST